MIKLFKNHLLILLLLGFAACSSNTNVGQDDLSISEIEDIEKTGEFSENDFFKDEEILKESGVSVDIEGLDDTNLKSKSNNLVSDLDVQDFEGEGFDKEDDFETDLAGNQGSSEFDEFDEFVTSDKVAKNEDVKLKKPSKAADIAKQPTMTEDDIFSEFEESTDVKSSGDKVDSMLGSDPFGDIEETPVVADKTSEPDLDFEEAFDETDSNFEAQVADSTPNIDTTLDTDVNLQDISQDSFEDVGTTVTDIDKDFGPGPKPKESTNIPPPKSDFLQAENSVDTRTAKQVISDQQFDTPDQIVETITRKVQSWIPVKKMREEPFRQNDILLNALYIVREGETFKSIGEKIYGKGSVTNLAKLNPFLNSKRLKVGEKVYYNSPNRPNDESKLLFYYDDIGRVPQYRQANEGENIRTIATQLLGHPRSWMEIWATNMEVVSKDILERPYRIKYFAKNNVQSMVQDMPEIGQPTSNEEANLGDIDEPINTNFNETTDVATNELPNLEEQPQVNDMDTIDPGTETPAANTGAANGNTDLDSGFDDPVAAENPAPQEPNFDEGFNEQPAQSGTQDGINGIPDNVNNQPQEAGGLNKLYFGMDQKMLETVGMGLGGLVLIIGILMIARRRRMLAQATQVQEFDFTGSTQIDEQTKTHIDI